MSDLAPVIERLLRDLDAPPGTPVNAKENIRDAIASSPYLQQRLEKEVRDAQLDRIVIQDRNGELGSFNDDTRAISVDLDVFNDFAENPRRLGDALTYVIGHEVGHSNLSGQRAGAIDALADAGRNSQWVESENGSVDMTPAVQLYLDASRQDEARSEIEG